jgi:hypothetical protein
MGDVLNELSKKIEPWSMTELQQLRSAARMGLRAYEQLYFELRPAQRKSIQDRFETDKKSKIDEVTPVLNAVITSSVLDHRTPQPPWAFGGF